MTFLAPSIAKVERKIVAGTSATNEPIETQSTIYAALPCLIDPMPVNSRMAGNLEVTIESVVYLATDVAVFDGLMPARFAGTPPGGSIVVDGIEYIVDGNGRGAYVDIAVNDRITDEDGRRYLVLAIARYPDVTPNLQARLAFGRSW